MAPPGQASRTGQGHWPTSRAGPCRRAGSRTGAAVSHCSCFQGWNGSFWDTTLHRCTSAPKRTGKGLHREKHEPVFAGWIPQLVWREGCRRSPFTGSHMLTHFTEQKQPGIDCRFGNSRPSPAESLQQRGGHCQGGGGQHSTGCPSQKPFLIRSTKPQGTQGSHGQGT